LLNKSSTIGIGVGSFCNGVSSLITNSKGANVCSDEKSQTIVLSFGVSSFTSSTLAALNTLGC
jgi:hypothetical protein